MLILGMAIKARQRPVVSGMEQLIDSVGEVLEDFDSHGWIRIHGERWEVQSNIPLKHGQKVRVSAVNGLILEVKPYLNHSEQLKED
jgi:membrane-bound serine protease (ClpP class)